LDIPTTIDLLSYSVAISVDREALLEPDLGHVFVDAPGPTLAYPCRVDRVRMCIDVPLAAAKGDARLRSYLREHYASTLPPRLKAAVTNALDGAPLTGAANHTVTTGACAVRGAALIGDSGGCSHPITAAGMTNGMHDVSILTDCISRLGLRDDALLLYQRRRYRFIRMRETFTRALYEILRASTPGARALREGLFAYWRSGARARRASIAILCGEDERLWSFAAEYFRVVMASATASVLSRSARDGTAFVTLQSTFETCLDAVKTALQKGASSAVLERTTRLAHAPSALAEGPDGRAREGGTKLPDDHAPHRRMPVESREAVEQSRSHRGADRPSDG
jgi:hypothetical protein